MTEQPTTPADDLPENDLWDAAMADAFAESDVPAPSAPAPGTVIGAYEVIGEVARGGMGVILRARDASIGREVAIKVMRSDKLVDDALVARFLEEAQVVGQMHHPGVVPIHQLGLDAANRPYFVMELVEGRTLAQLLRDRTSPMADRGRFFVIFHQVLRTLAHAHGRDVIHRDLKPENIMVGELGAVRVVDWGFAKVLGDVPGSPPAPQPSEGFVVPAVAKVATRRSGHQSSQSMSGAVFGTPAYMPPEQARGDALLSDKRSDVFSLGAILLEILTGRPPHVAKAGERLTDVAARGDMCEAFERLDAAAVEPDLVALTRRCLAPDPAHRPRDAAEVEHVFAEFLAMVEERARQAETTAAVERGRATSERRARWLTVGFASFAVIVVVAATAVWLQGRVRDQEQLHEAELRLNDMLHEVEARLGEGSFAAAAEALDRARGFASGTVVPFSATSTIDALAARIHAAKVKADEDRAAAEHLAAIGKRFEDLLGDPGGEPWTIDTAYYGLFQALGIDPLFDDVEAVATKLLAIDAPMRETLIAALEDWASRRRTLFGLTRPNEDMPISHDHGHDHAHTAPPVPAVGLPGREVFEWSGARERNLLRIAELADPDAQRNALREAVLDGKKATLLRMATQIRPRELSPRSLELLGVSLLRSGESRNGIEILRAAALAHPGDFWLHHQLSVALSRYDSRSRTHLADAWNVEALRHAWMALALKPDAFIAREHLAGVLAATEDIDGAIAVLRSGAARPNAQPRARTALCRALIAIGRAHEVLEIYRGIEPLPQLEDELTAVEALVVLGRYEEAMHRLIHVDLYDDLQKSNIVENIQALAMEATLADENAPEPNDAAARLRRARVLVERHRIDEAANLVLSLMEEASTVPSFGSFPVDLGQRGPRIAYPDSGPRDLVAVLVLVGTREDGVEDEATIAYRARLRAAAQRAVTVVTAARRGPRSRRRDVDEWFQDPRIAAVRDFRMLVRLPVEEAAAWSRLWLKLQASAD